MSNELVTLQIQNRDKLKQILKESPPECGSLAKNTQKFFNLYEGIEKKVHAKVQSLRIELNKENPDSESTRTFKIDHNLIDSSNNVSIKCIISNYGEQ